MRSESPSLNVQNNVMNVTVESSAVEHLVQAAEYRHSEAMAGAAVQHALELTAVRSVALGAVAAVYDAANVSVQQQLQQQEQQLQQQLLAFSTRR